MSLYITCELLWSSGRDEGGIYVLFCFNETGSDELTIPEESPIRTRASTVSILDPSLGSCLSSAAALPVLRTIAVS